LLTAGNQDTWGQENGAVAGIEVLMPRDRVPLSFVIDDSTCLVNMGHFCTPQFATAWPDRAEYQKPWKSWPREIPDTFVREFGEWSAENGVKGKYSIVPYPACVGWLDRELPGWSRKELQASLALVRDLMVPNWDIHPEMITHTRVIDLKTARPFEDIHAGTMENSYPQETKSVDELAAYLAYALRILKNCGLPCEGVTTPGGFGNKMRNELATAVHHAVRDVFGAELPHYFKYVRSGDQDTQPQLENQHQEGENLTATVNVPAGTGDWFGGWQGDTLSEGERYVTLDGTGGRMIELIKKHVPAIMLCHWPGMYSNGSKEGFHQFQRIVSTIREKHGHETNWMKMSEIARYWAAKAWTRFEPLSDGMKLKAGLAAKQFTFRCSLPKGSILHKDIGHLSVKLKQVDSKENLDSGTWFVEGKQTLVCLDLPKGDSEIRVNPE
jgi:hypothetical protein